MNPHHDRAAFVTLIRPGKHIQRQAVFALRRFWLRRHINGNGVILGVLNTDGPGLTGIANILPGNNRRLPGQLLQISLRPDFASR